MVRLLLLKDQLEVKKENKFNSEKVSLPLKKNLSLMFKLSLKLNKRSKEEAVKVALNGLHSNKWMSKSKIDLSENQSLK
jgi:hypothetical protein